MNNNKVIELRQKLTSLEMADASLQKQSESQQRNVTIGYITLVVAIVLTLGSIEVGAILLIGVIIYLVIAVKKKNLLLKQCEDSQGQILKVKNELIAEEHS